MSKNEQILIINPAQELTFIGPFTSAVSSVMKLTNPSDRRVCFKIKTTAPKRYCVKPNSGVIEPAQAVQVSVSLQPFEFDPADKNKHKFMVQSMYAPEGEINQETLWREADASTMMDSKLRCLFVMPDDNSSGLQASGLAMSNVDSRSADSQAASAKSTIPPSPKNDNDSKRQVMEIIKLQEENSALRQENIQLKEETLRQKRLAASKGNDSGGKASSGLQGGDYNATTIVAGNPNATAISPAHMYAGLLVLILGVVIGKWFL